MPVIANPVGPGFIDVSSEQAARINTPLPQPSGPTRMVDPNGKMFDVPPTSYHIAVKNGWRDASDAEKKEEESISKEASQSDALDVFGKKFINEAAFGIPETYQDLTASSPEQLKHQQAVREREMKQHPIAGHLGQALGFGVPLLIPGVGEVGEAARLAVEGGAKVAERAAISATEKEALKLGMTAASNATDISLGRKVAASAAKYTAEGALYSTPQAAVQITYGDPEKAAETMLWGAGLSGVLGGVGRAIGEGSRLATKSAGKLLTDKQANGITYLDDISRNILGITDAQANSLGPARLTKIVERADQEGLLGMDPAKRPEAIKAMLNDSGTKIAEHQDKLESLLQNPDIKEMGPVPTKTAAKFQQELIGKFPEIFSATHAPQLKLASKIEEDILAGGNDPSFAKLQEIRKTIASARGDFLADSASAKIIRLADKVIQQDLEQSAQQIYHAGELPQHFADYLSQKERYSVGQDLAENLNPFKGTGKLPTKGLTSLGFLTVAAGLSGHGGAAATDLALKYFLNNNHGLLGKTASYLRKAVQDPNTADMVGGLMAKEGVTALQDHIDSIPSILTKDKVVAHSIAAANPVSSLVGSTQGLTYQQQYDKLVNKIKSAATNVGMTADNIGDQSLVFTNHNLQLGNLVAQKNFNALNYLTTQIPKGPDPKPFQRSEWQPTKQQQTDFLNKVSIVNDPMVVWKHYQDGTLGKTDKDVLTAVYPKIYTEMVNKIMTTAFDPREKPLTYSQRMQLSAFVGQPLDNSLKNISSIQQALAAPPASEQQPSAPNRERHTAQPRPSPRPKFEHAPNLQTDTQRRTYGGR